MSALLNSMLNSTVDLTVTFFTDWLMPLMFVAFLAGMAARTLVWYTVKREEWFVFEFEKRLTRFLEHDEASTRDPLSFYVALKRNLERTFYELFEVRSVMRRRRVDHVTEPADRIFLIQEGCAYLVRDTLKAARGLKKTAEEEEKREMSGIAGYVMGNNAAFSRVLGLAPVAPVNDFLNQLPGLFIVGGIFGTFLGIMKGLPALSGMDLNNAEGTKQIMDDFLIKIAYSMGTSIIGIIFSVTMQIYNAFLNPERLFMQVVEKYDALLGLLWRRSDHNEIPNGLTPFDEHRDPVEALAELAVQKEITSAEQRRLKTKTGTRAVGATPPAQTAGVTRTGMPVPPPAPKDPGNKAA